MSKTTTKYSINQIKQIIPLNENIVNFELNFEIKSENNAHFKAVVLSDDELNSEKPINYQEVKNGIINGNIVNDKGVYQLYYLLLKADQPVDCDITIDIKEIPINAEIQRMRQEQINQERQNIINIKREREREQERKRQIVQQSEQREIERKNKEEQKRLQELQQKENEKQEKNKRQLFKKAQEKEESKTKWIIAFVIFVGIVALGIWFLFFNKKNKIKKINLNNVSDTIFQKVEVNPPKIQDIESILRIEPGIPKLNMRSEMPIVSTVPEMPKLDLRPEMQIRDAVPELPKLDIRPELPKLDVRPEMQMRDAVPELPKLDMRSEIVEAPKFETPKIDGTSRRNNNLLSKLNNYFDN